MSVWLGKFLYRHFPIRKDVALANLRLCFPEKGDGEIETIIEKAYTNVAKVFLEFLYFPKLTKENIKGVVEFPDESYRLIQSALERGKGLILMSGHFGNWEIVALAVGAFSPKPLSIIVHPFHNKPVDKYANRYRSLLGNSTVPMDNSVRASLSTLRENGIVALLADQSSAKESLTARFFGMERPDFSGPGSVCTQDACNHGDRFRDEKGRRDLQTCSQRDRLQRSRR